MGSVIRYIEDASGQPPVIGIIYIERWALGNAPPEKLTITIGEAEG